MNADIVTVVPIGPEHVEGFHRTLDAVARERRYLTLLEAFPLDETRTFVLDNIEKGNPAFVALNGAEVVGWCDIRRDFFPAHAHRGTLGVGLLPAFRGLGLGKPLMQATIVAAQQAEMTRIELSVHADNGRAIALYERLGFIREGVQRDAFRVDGRSSDTIMMALLSE